MIGILPRACISVHRPNSIPSFSPKPNRRQLSSMSSVATFESAPTLEKMNLPSVGSRAKHWAYLNGLVRCRLPFANDFLDHA